MAAHAGHGCAAFAPAPAAEQFLGFAYAAVGARRTLDKVGYAFADVLPGLVVEDGVAAALDAGVALKMAVDADGVARPRIEFDRIEDSRPASAGDVRGGVAVATLTA